jgi:hypothetical protein
VEEERSQIRKQLRLHSQFKANLRYTARPCLKRKREGWLCGSSSNLSTIKKRKKRMKERKLQFKLNLKSLGCSFVGAPANIPNKKEFINRLWQEKNDNPF